MGTRHTLRTPLSATPPHVEYFVCIPTMCTYFVRKTCLCSASFTLAPRARVLTGYSGPEVDRVFASFGLQEHVHYKERVNVADILGWHTGDKPKMRTRFSLESLGCALAGLAPENGCGIASIERARLTMWLFQVRTAPPEMLFHAHLQCCTVR